MSDNTESRLDAALRALGGEMRDVEAPARVESALRSEFRRRRRNRGLLLWSGALAAALLLVALLPNIKFGTEPLFPDFAAAPKPLVAPTEVAAIPERKVIPAAPKVQQITPRRPAPATAPPREIVTSFIPTEFWDDRTPMERGHLVRVRVPRATLMRYGLPVNPSRSDEQILADLLLGEDGMARAIRFVQNR